jgi:L-ascorbate metabolism protein UlaG (beta-lactamase superfamily)
VTDPLLSDDAFLTDVERVRGRDGLHIWWLGQSGFLVSDGKLHALLDPYLSESLTVKYANTDKPHVRMVRRVVDPRRLGFVSVVSSSHNHTDHLDADTIRPLKEVNPGLKIIVPEANRRFVSMRLGVSPDSLIGVDDGQTVVHDGWDFVGIPAAHEAIDRDEHGRCLYLGLIIKVGAHVVYHSGDTVLYEGLVDNLRRFSIDIALLPINGRAPERRVAGNLTGAEAARLAKGIGAKLVIPCHYDMFEFNTASPDGFVAECERLNQPYRVLGQGERISIAQMLGNGS